MNKALHREVRLLRAHLRCWCCAFTPAYVCAHGHGEKSSCCNRWAAVTFLIEKVANTTIFLRSFDPAPLLPQSNNVTRVHYKVAVAEMTLSEMSC